MARNSIQRKFLPVFLFILGFQSAFAADVISYTGRLVNTNGSPVTGPVNLKIDLFYSGNLSSLKCSKTFGNVPLKNGVFHLNIDYASGDCGSKPFAQIVQEIPDNETMAISVTDESHSKTYSHHAVQAVPLSMLSAAAKTLTAPPAGTPAGHVLKWNGTAWEAAADGGGAGTVTGITAGTGINVTQNVNDYTVSIANGGVGNTQLANGIDRSKLAVGTPNQIVANDNTGVMTSISVLPLGMGGTGATTAADARTNLGLGTAATANVGLGVSDVLSASGINTCQPWEKLSFNLAPVVGWTCVNEYSDTTKLSLTGGTMTGAIDMSNNKITNLGTPTVGTDAATKAYVDSAASAASTSVWSLSGSDVFRTLGKVGIGTNTPQAVLDIASTTSGVLVPRMTTAERDAIASPIAGMVLYNTTTNKLNFYDTAWKEVGVSGAGITSINIGTGLTPAGAFTSGGTIAIAAGGVSNTELAASAVTDTKVAAGANIARSKLASGTANHIVINDGTGAMSSTSKLPIAMGGTGLNTLGTSNQVLGMNNAAGALEYKNIVGGTGVSIAHTPNTITVTATGAPPTGAAGGDLSGTYPNPTLNTVPVSKGGTGLTSLTPRGVLSGDAAGTGVIGTACASGQYLGFNVSGDPTCYNVSNITANSFVNGGNDFGGIATLGTNGAGQALHFETAGTTKMSIEAGGNVGIGATVASSRLTVESTANILMVRNPDANDAFSGGTMLEIANTGISTTNKYLSFVADKDNDETGTVNFGSITLGGNNSLSISNPSGSPVAIQVGAGNVGIGTSTPNEKLTIEGVTSLKEQAAAPAATANYGKLYVKSADSKLYFMNDAGVETALGTATAGSVDSSAISDGSIVDADVSATANIAQSKIANLTTDLAAKQPLDAELTAVAGLSTDGIMVKSGAGSVITRTIVGAAGRTFVSNGNGATGNPTVDISNALLPSPVAGDVGKFLKTTGPGVSSWTALASGDITTALGFTPINKATDTINSGIFTFGGSSVVRVLDPILPTDAANRQWVEAQIAAGAGNGFVNNGNDFGGNAVLGTNGAGQSLSIKTAGTTKMHIDSAGNVGIGTTAPAYPFEVRDSSNPLADGNFYITPGGAGINRAGDSANGANFLFRTSRGTHTAPLISQVGDQSGRIEFYSYDGDEYARTAMIHSRVSTGVANDSTPGSLVFSTTPTGSKSPLERMRIESNGNIGIGVVAPEYALHIRNTGNLGIESFGGTPGIYTRKANGTSLSPTAVMNSNTLMELAAVGYGATNYLTTSAAKIMMTAEEDWTDATGAGGIRFHTRPSGSLVSSIERMRITSTGNVGIGATDPNEKLTVEGNLALKEGTAPTLTAGYGKLYVNSADSKLYFMNDSGTSVELGSSTPAAGSITSSMIADSTIVDADVSATANIAQSKIANLTTDLAAKQPLDAELTAVAGLSTDGIMVKSGAGSVITRTIVGAAGRTFVSNGNGATGNPTVDISNALLPSPIAGDEGKFLKTTGPGVSSWSALASGDITTALGFTPINKTSDTINSGTFTFGGSSVVRVLDPVLATDAANRQWVEAQIAAAGGSTAFKNGGNSFGANALLGLNDSFSLGFETAGTTKMTILADGKVGIGTTSPGSSLHISNASSSLSLQSTTNGNFTNLLMSGNDTGGTYRQANITFKPSTTTSSLEFFSNAFAILSNGNVGVGTLTPASKLETTGSIFVSTSGIDATVGLRASGGSGRNYYLTSSVTDGSFQLYDGTSASYKLTVDSAGKTGIGTVSPRAKLDINGSIVSAPANGVAGATKDYLNGNIQYTTGNCGAYALHNLKDGGSYTFVVQGTTAATCSFTAFSDAGTTALTVHLPPDHGATTAGKHTVYSFFVAGTHAYFAWVPGM